MPNTGNSYTAEVDAHGVLVLKLTNSSPVSAPQFTYYEAAADGNTLAGGASIRNLDDSVSVVGFIGNGGTLTFNGIDGGPEGGDKLLSIDYINAEVDYFNDDCSNCRNAYVSVNGGDTQRVELPISGQVRLCRKFACRVLGG
jgi:alpha-galactosidase